MFEHAIIKNSNPVVKESLERVFGKLEPVSKMNPNRFEFPLTSIRRILGDKFYDLSNSDTDVLRMLVCDNGGFNLTDVLNNPEKINELMTMISFVFQGFVECNQGQSSFTKEFMETPIAKICVTTNKGLASMDLKMSDLGSLATYGNDHTIIGLKNFVEVSNLVAEIKKTDEAIQQMANINNGNAVVSLQETRADYHGKLLKLHEEIILNWFEFIAKFSNSDKVEDIYDVTVIFTANFKDDSGGEPVVISGMTLLNYHDGASRNISLLKGRFSINDMD